MICLLRCYECRWLMFFPYMRADTKYYCKKCYRKEFVRKQYVDKI